MMRAFGVLVVVAALNAGCAVGQSIAYHDASPALQASAPIALAVAVQDQRPEVTSGRKSPTFVGLLRGGFGNTFDVTTKSGRPLAADFTQVVSRSLAARSFRVVPLVVQPTAPVPAVLAAAQQSRADRVLLIQLAAWKSDTYMGTRLVYAVGAQVVSVADGRLLGATQSQGERDLGSSAFNPGGHAKRAVPPAFAEALEGLLNAPEIVAALSPAPPTAGVTATLPQAGARGD